MAKRRVRRPWGGGSITETGDGRWRIRYDGPGGPGGERRQISEKFTGSLRQPTGKS